MSKIRITKNNINWSHVGWDEYSVSKGNYADESTIKKDYWGNDGTILEAVPIEVDGKEVYRIDEVDKNGNRTGMGFIDKEGIKNQTNTHGYERAEESFQNTSNQPNNNETIGKTNTHGYEREEELFQRTSNHPKKTSSEEKVDLVDKSNNKTNTKGYEREEELFQRTSNHPKNAGDEAFKNISSTNNKIEKGFDEFNKFVQDQNKANEQKNTSSEEKVDLVDESNNKTNTHGYEREEELFQKTSNHPKSTENNIKSASQDEAYIDYEKIKNADIKNIVKMNEEEIKNAEATHISDTTYMALNNVDVNGYNMKVAHIYITDPSQLKCIQSQSNEGEDITSLAKKTEKPVIGTVGGFFKSGSNRQNLEGTTNRVYILDGKLADTCNIHDITPENVNDAMNTTAGGQEICIDKDGKIFYAPKGATAKQLIEDYNVVNTFTSHEARRIDNGEIIQTAEWNKDYDRTYLCMKKPGEYYILQGYCTPEAVTNYAKEDLGVEFCGSLEQGGATAMNINGKTVRNHEGYNTVGNAFFVTD